MKKFNIGDTVRIRQKHWTSVLEGAFIFEVVDVNEVMGRVHIACLMFDDEYQSVEVVDAEMLEHAG